ncbi:hypothetical protein [uncultured Roseibium sp.]|uniref:hypothetical protein n=1 Tax=uncultured Roseibium sp. TaxID=1936171 RepID=UPI0026196487|nr:hypothetical protein [uncultured Roseibium sp.]
MALSAEKIGNLVAKGFSGAGDIIKAGILRASTAAYDPATGKSTPIETDSPVSVFFDGLAGKGGENKQEGKEVLPTDAKAYLTGSTFPPKTGMSVIVGATTYEVILSGDESADTGHLYLAFLRG